MQQPPTQTRIVTIWRPSTQTAVKVFIDDPISDAANDPLLQPGDIIFASCGYGGNSGNQEVVQFGIDESWPIEIKPGIAIRGYVNPTYNAPIMITATASNPPPAGVPLVRFVDAPAGWNAPDPQAELKGLYVVGGDIGVQVASASGNSLDVLVEDVVFSRNRTALQPLEVGLRFWSLAAASGGDSARIDAELINFQTVGGFPSSIMNPIGKLAGSPEPCDLANYQPASGGVGTFTRLVEVGTRGLAGRLEYPELPNTTKQTVCSVRLSLDGGVLDGKAAPGSSRGWDVGIYAVADYADVAAGLKFNYTSWFEVETNGSVVDNCRAAGIYVQTNTDTRGHLSMNNQTIVRNTGVHLSGNTSDVLHSGVHAVAKRS